MTSRLTGHPLGCIEEGCVCPRHRDDPNRTEHDMTDELDVLASQALGITTAAAMLDNAARTVGALCSGVERHGFYLEPTRKQLVSLSEHLLPAVLDWIVTSPAPEGNLDGLSMDVSRAATDLDTLVQDIATALNFGGGPPDDWPDRLDDIGNAVLRVVTKVRAALTLADAPMNGGQR